MKKYLPKLTPQLIATLAILMAVHFVLAKFRIMITPTLRISFTFIANGLIGFFGGPFLTAIIFGVMDIINFVTNPQGTYIPLYTVAEIITGFFYGFFYYRKVLSTRSVKDWIYVSLVTTFMVGITTFGMTPLLFQIYFKTPYWAQMAAGRIFKIIEIPIHALIFMLILPQVQRLPEVKKWLKEKV